VNTVSATPPRKPRRPTRVRTSAELDRAATLRPAEIFARYGIPASSLQRFCTAGPEENRLPSIRIGCWRGRRGVRLVERTDLEAWLAWQKAGSSENFTAWRTAKRPAA